MANNLSRFFFLLPPIATGQYRRMHRRLILSLEASILTSIRRRWKSYLVGNQESFEEKLPIQKRERDGSEALRGNRLKTIEPKGFSHEKSLELGRFDGSSEGNRNLE
ncbi:hypothetical protein AVEN_89567-1 [Araneus ventricosus]|uniref:Uncharacterized protein n=1 Tax=Araneus ventricosus TaxID=182803 RepID=A0A4Y2GUT3_ARAVE|nr:hypothetical protein AVEN_89567-1 [Araneus ventricosus]